MYFLKTLRLKNLSRHLRRFVHCLDNVLFWYQPKDVQRSQRLFDSSVHASDNKGCIPLHRHFSKLINDHGSAVVLVQRLGRVENDNLVILDSLVNHLRSPSKILYAESGLS